MPYGNELFIKIVTVQEPLIPDTEWKAVMRVSTEDGDRNLYSQHVDPKELLRLMDSVLSRYCSAHGYQCVSAWWQELCSSEGRLSGKSPYKASDEDDISF